MFHVQNGTSFRRTEDGSVELIVKPGEEPVAVELFTPESWASVVASMSAAGENLDTYQAALDRQKGEE